MKDKIKWGFIILLLCIGLLIQFGKFINVSGSQLIWGWIILTIFGLGMAATTTQGKIFQVFAKESQIEIRKVFWPTRQETIQTTLVVLAMVIVMGLILWGMDTMFLWIVGILTGQKG